MSDPAVSLSAVDRSAVDPAAPIVGVSRLRLTDFRNYAMLNLTLAPDRGVVLWGSNGAGKSNLLEAVSYLGPGRGLRAAKLDMIDRTPGGGPWAVAGEVQTPQGPVMIGGGRVTGESGYSRRAIRINGAAVSRSAALGQWLAIIWLTPDMDRLFSGGGDRRRRFLDRLAIGLSPDHGASVAAYERALRERGKLLRDHGPAADPAWLAALEGHMAAHGVAMAVARRDAARRLEICCARSDGPFPGPRIVLAGDVDAWLEDGPALAAEERLRADLATSRPRDAVAGGAAVGPHRSDWTAFDRRHDRPAACCSTGEQKALLISLILACAEAIFEHCSMPPLLLLDEVVAHLDEQRRAALFDRLRSLGGQFWLTGIEEKDFSALGGQAQFLKIDQGRVASQPVGVVSESLQGRDFRVDNPGDGQSSPMMEG